MWVRKSDLCYNGFNTAASVGRAVFAPITTLASEKKTFWIEHWWIIF
jgi:hypothetical protein